MRRMRGSLGLLGRIFAILLLTVVVEFGASTMLYERAGSFSVREDEARRLAEHLVITRKLLAEREASARPAMANELTTDRYSIHWAKGLPAPPPLTGDLVEMRGQIVTWEPGLAQSDLRLGLAGARRGSIVTGGLKLPDGSWVYFSARGIVREWTLALGHIALALIPALALLIVGGLLIRRTLQPIQRLAEATAHLGSGTHVAIAESGTAEVRNLIHAFNEMQLRIHRLIKDRTQALAAVGHDIRTPLSRIQLRLDGVAEPQVREAIGADVAEMNAMVASLLAFLNGEDDPEQPTTVDIAVLAATIVDEVSDRGDTAGYTGPTHLEVKVRQVAIRRALGNLVENAIHYGGTARITVENKGGHVILGVEDNGPGIPEDRLVDVLTPFMRLDDARARNTQGLGLGLAIVARTVERENGTLRLSNRIDGGLRAEISLPKA